MKVSIKRDHGMLKVDIDGRLYAPLSFKSFRPNPKNISEFYAAGVRLFSVLSSGVINALGVPYSLFGESWIGEDEYDFSVIDKQLDMFIENAPEAYFALMLQLDTRPWYLEAHPGTPNSFTSLSQIACDSEWRAAAARYLKAAISHCEKKYGERIYGYFLLGGTTTEWFSGRDREASHPIKEAGYRRYLGKDGAVLPSEEELSREGRVFLSQEEENVYRARKFHAETIADLVLYFAKEAQSVIKHKKLLGLYYGYLFELSGERIFNFGHLAYERVFLSPDVDMISSPSAYGYRGLLDPSAFMVTQRTLDLHNKLYFLEFDHITHVAPTMIYEPCIDSNGNGDKKQIPGADSKCKCASESLNLMWRDFILCYANGTAMWWFDMFDGWFRSDEMMGAIGKMIDLHRELAERPKHSVAEIAVFAEGESMYRVRKSSQISTVCLSDMRRVLAESGAPYDLYSISDLDSLDFSRYKFIIMLNAYDIPPSRMARIREIERDGKAVLMLFAPNYARDGVCDVGRISEALGFAVSKSEKPHGGLVYRGEITPYTDNAPYFSVSDKGAHPYAFFENGETAVAAKGRAVYSALPFITSPLLRELLRDSGVFIYSDDPKVYTYVGSGAICAYNATDGEAVISVREDGEYLDGISGERFSARNGKLTLPMRELRAYMLIKERNEKEI